MTKNRKIIAIVGPTASGKTGIGVKLAKELGGEIISADSRQVYRGLDLGTGKDGRPCRQVTSYKLQVTNKKQYNNLSIEQLKSNLRCVEDIPQWMIDICEPGERFTLFDYLPLVRATIEDIFNRGKVPIIVGGTGLYIQALVEGFEQKFQITNNKSQTNSKIQKSVIPTPRHCSRVEESSNKRSLDFARDDNYTREQLNNLTIEQLNSLLKELAPELLETIDTNNPHRLIRAIERAREGNVPIKSKPDFEVLQIGITWPNEVLYSRIDKRVEERFEQGMLEEIIDLLNRGVSSEWLLGLGLEYREITNYILECHPALDAGSRGSGFQVKPGMTDASFEQMKETLKLRSHQFSKRQMTWFRRFPEIVWENDYNKISKIAKKFLK